MKELFFSLLSRKLFMVLLRDGKVLGEVCEDNYRKHSENFVLKVGELFSGVSFPIADLDRIFFLTGPGGQTGERVSLSFVLGSLLSNPTLRIFSMDSLTFQAAAFKECLSVVSTGDKSKSYHLAAYQQQSVLLRREGIREEEFKEVREMFPNLLVKTDLVGTDFLHNFLICKKEFKAFVNELVQF